jgi:hypothetical protein
MTRIQVGRDRAMAQAIVKAKRPGQTVLLIAGAGHVVRALGVPQHLPDDVKIAAVRLMAAPASADRRLRPHLAHAAPARERLLRRVQATGQAAAQDQRNTR